jgi:hypothetical protein
MKDKLEEIDRCFEAAIKNYERLNHEASRNCCIEGRRLIAALQEAALTAEQIRIIMFKSGNWNPKGNLSRYRTENTMAEFNFEAIAADLRAVTRKQ